jgi:uncharacterized protein (DUF3820 family)
MDNFSKTITGSPNSSACGDGTAAAVTPEKKKVSFDEMQEETEDEGSVDKSGDISKETEDEGFVDKSGDISKDMASGTLGAKDESTNEFVQHEKYYVYLAILKTNPFQSIVGLGKGKKLKDVVDTRYSLIAFIVGAANAEEAADLQQRWESDLIIVDSLEEQVLEGQSLCVQLAYKYPKLKIVVDWDNVERKQSLRTGIAKIPDVAMVQPTQNVHHPNSNKSSNKNSDCAENLETLGNLVMPFGKHIGKSYQTIVEVFPEYVDWARTLTCPDTVLERLVKYANCLTNVPTENAEKPLKHDQDPSLYPTEEKKKNPSKQQMCIKNNPYSNKGKASESNKIHNVAPVDDSIGSHKHPAFEKQVDSGTKSMDVKCRAITNKVHNSAQKVGHGCSLHLPHNDEVEFIGAKQPFNKLTSLKRCGEPLDGNCMKKADIMLNGFNVNETSMVSP